MGVYSTKTFAMGCVLVNLLIGVAMGNNVATGNNTDNFDIHAQGDDVVGPYCQFKDTCWEGGQSQQATIQAQFIAPDRSTDDTTETMTTS